MVNLKGNLHSRCSKGGANPFPLLIEAAAYHYADQTISQSKKDSVRFHSLECTPQWIVVGHLLV